MDSTSAIEQQQPPPAPEIPPRALVDVLGITKRLQARDDWPELELIRNDMMKRAKRAKLGKDQAQAWTYSTLDHLYPAIPAKPQEPAVAAQDTQTAAGQTAEAPDQGITQATGNISAPSGEGERPAGGATLTRGLGHIPANWPELPANASLAAEIGWVQANRLYVVEEQAGGGTRVRLDRAHEPAPSRAAIGWLETSIRSYAKFVEVAAKASGAGVDEQDQARQERMALEDIRSLLAEML
jgi:hypothetical protein